MNINMEKLLIGVTSGVIGATIMHLCDKRTYEQKLADEIERLKKSSPEWKEVELKKLELEKEMKELNHERWKEEHAAELEIEKNAPDSYWNYKAEKVRAETEKETRLKEAEIKKETEIAVAKEGRKLGETQSYNDRYLASSVASAGASAIRSLTTSK